MLETKLFYRWLLGAKMEDAVKRFLILASHSLVLGLCAGLFSGLCMWLCETFVKWPDGRPMVFTLPAWIVTTTVSCSGFVAALAAAMLAGALTNEAIFKRATFSIPNPFDKTQPT